MVFEHVVFDLDGTLIDSRVDLAAAVNHALRTLQLPELPVETICGYIGEGARRLVQRALGAAHQDRLDEGLALFMTFYRAHLLDHTRAYPGIDALLAALAAMGVTLSVLSNKPAAMSRAILAGLDLLHRFVVVLGGDSFLERKPDPAGIDYVCNLTHTPHERLLVVGDSTIDAQTARAARVAFCGVAWGLAPASLRAAAEPIIDRPSELLAIVARGF
ncbi:MAG: HAD family hydrolase [Candidatus Binatia bacterium]